MLRDLILFLQTKFAKSRSRILRMMWVCVGRWLRPSNLASLWLITDRAWKYSYQDISFARNSAKQLIACSQCSHAGIYIYIYIYIKLKPLCCVKNMINYTWQIGFLPLLQAYCWVFIFLIVLVVLITSENIFADYLSFRKLQSVFFLVINNTATLEQEWSTSVPTSNLWGNIAPLKFSL